MAGNELIEEHWIRVEGLRQRLWLLRPRDPGRFPVLVWNHGSQVTITADGQVIDHSDSPQIKGDAPDRRRWVRQLRCVLLIPEGRGYGGSEGPRLASVLGDAEATMCYLAARARDANAAADWAALHDSADPERMVIAGASHGGVVAMLAGAERRYAGTAALAVAVWPNRADIGTALLRQAVARGQDPLLLQHLLNDRSAPAGVGRLLHAEALAAGRPATLREYHGAAALDGHRVFAPGNRGLWEQDFLGFVTTCCGAALAVE